jgi:hypothetical protein
MRPLTSLDGTRLPNTFGFTLSTVTATLALDGTVGVLTRGDLRVIR